MFRLVTKEWKVRLEMVLKDQKVISTKSLFVRDVWSDRDSFGLKCPNFDQLVDLIRKYFLT